MVAKELVDRLDADTAKALEGVHMSYDETVICCVLIQKSAPLEYELETVKTESGENREMYKVPEASVMAALSSACPNVEAYDMSDADEMFMDLHSGRIVRTSELRIIRFADRNVIVSPHYAETGGMLVDLMPCSSDGAPDLSNAVVSLTWTLDDRSDKEKAKDEETV